MAQGKKKKKISLHIHEVAPASLATGTVASDKTIRRVIKQGNVQNIISLLKSQPDAAKRQMVFVPLFKLSFSLVINKVPSSSACSYLQEDGAMALHIAAEFHAGTLGEQVGPSFSAAFATDHVKLHLLNSMCFPN